MKKLLTLITLGLTLGLGTAHAADEKAPAKKPTKLAQCSSEAKGLKGDEYKKKRDECMKGDAAPAAASGKTAQQEKMKSCNTEAKGKKGDERKAFMKDCLKK